MPATNPWDETAPAGSSLMSSVDDIIRTLKLDLRERLAICFYWGSDVTHDGKAKALLVRPLDNTSILLLDAPNSLTGANAQSMIDLAQTWDTAGAPSAVKIDITDTNSGATSKFLDFLVAGVSKFSVSKAGRLTTVGILTSAPIEIPAGTEAAPAIIFTGQVGKGFYLLNNEWAFKGLLNMVDNILQRPVFQDYGELVTMPAASEIDFTASNVKQMDNVGARVITLVNPPAANVMGTMLLHITAGAGAVADWTWPASVKWANGTEPILTTTAGKVDLLSFLTIDGGVTYKGGVYGLNF